MSIQEYQYASGYNNSGSLVNVEDTIPDNILNSDGISLGSVERVAIDGTKYLDGYQVAIWRFDWITQTDFNTLCTDMLGDTETISAPVTVRTTKWDGTYGNYNAAAHRPTTFGRRKGGILTGVEFVFIIVGAAS